MRTEQLYARTSRNRLAIADVLDSLDAEQWDAATLCKGWTVRHVAAHLLQPMLVGFPRFFLTAVRYRGDTLRTVDHFARVLARNEPEQLVALLRAHAPAQVDPPRVGPIGPFAETCIHLRDIARPLGLAATAPQEDWIALLDHLTSDGPTPALATSQRTAGISLEATDAEWRSGSGPRVSGSTEALTMAITGRVPALDDLHGPGVDLLRARL
ncbi:MAG: maleylpyruvate isomerase family mycothiol-dependent enzyme [Ornithinibacter sp.]